VEVACEMFYFMVNGYSVNIRLLVVHSVCSCEYCARGEENYLQMRAE